LLGLDQPPSRDQEFTIRGRRTVENGFTSSREYFETSVDRPTGRLSVRIVFPKGRPPNKAYVTTEGESTTKLPVRLRGDGRATVRWLLRKPTQGIVYGLRWAW
jgi:hypothetical protein